MTCHVQRGSQTSEASMGPKENTREAPAAQVSEAELSTAIVRRGTGSTATFFTQVRHLSFPTAHSATAVLRTCIQHSI